MYYPDQPFHIRTYKKLELAHLYSIQQEQSVMNNKENLFIIRTYTKAELAHLYNPTACIKVALQILRRWILFNLPLLHELEAEGYRARNRLLSPKQVATIVQYLGEP